MQENGRLFEGTRLADMTMSATIDVGALGLEIFRHVVEDHPSGMVIGGGDGNVMMINGEIERLFGYHRQELLGQPVEILLPEELRNEHAKHRNGFGFHPDGRALGNGRDYS